MGGGGSQTSTQKSEPWSGQQPYLKDLFRSAQGLYNQGPQEFYPGSTVAPFAPQQQQAMDMMTNRALSGSPQEQAFGSYLQSQLGQQNLDPSMMVNPAMQAAGGVGAGQNLMMQAGSGNPYMGSAANALSGMTGYGGLGESRAYAGDPRMGALPASEQYVNQMLQSSGGNFGDYADQIGGRLGGVSDAARQSLAQTSQGGYLGSNPYLDQMFDTAAGRAGEAFNEQTMPGIAAMFGGAGRTGGGIQQETVQNAARQFGRDLQGMAADIYSPAYESERDRMTQAASQLGGLDVSEGQLGLGGMNLAGDLYGGDQQRRLGAANLGGDLFGQYNQADLGRANLGSDLYLGGRQLGQQAATNLGNLGSQFGQLQLGAGQGLGNLGMQGVNAMGDLYGNIAQNQFRAGSLVPSYSGLEYGNMDRLMGVGNQIQGQAQDLIGGNMQRWGFNQQAPWDALNNYASVIHGLPGGYGTQTSTQPTGSKLGGAVGGAMAGAPLGPWGIAGGALMGLLG